MVYLFSFSHYEIAPGDINDPVAQHESSVFVSLFALTIFLQVTFHRSQIQVPVATAYNRATGLVSPRPELAF